LEVGVTQETDGPRGIGGWLVLMLLQLLIGPVRVLAESARELGPLLSDGSWAELTTPGTEIYHPLWAPLITFELVANLVTIVLGIVTLVYFLRKSQRTPSLVTIWLAWQALTATADHILLGLIPGLEPDPMAVPNLVRVCFLAALWIVYFRVSKRVKATFVE